MSASNNLKKVFGNAFSLSKATRSSNAVMAAKSK